MSLSGELVEGDRQLEGATSGPGIIYHLFLGALRSAEWKYA